MTFGEIAIGTHFRFVDGGKAYGPSVKKVSANKYVRVIKDVITRNGKTKIRTVLAEVLYRGASAPVAVKGRKSPLRKRRGRGRASGWLLA
jgi:hypothetical protein